MSTFHPFSRLPIELRIRIWHLTAFPRIVHMKHKLKILNEQRVLYMATSTPCPPVMQASRESRQHAPYQRAYKNDYEPRYTWINFETDMVCNDNGGNPLLHKPHEQDIQRLKFSIDNDRADYWFFYYGFKVIPTFSNVKEIHVAVKKDGNFGVRFMADALEHGCWDGYEDIVTFLDAGSGLMMNANQLRLLSDWSSYYSFDSYGKAVVDTSEEDPEWLKSDWVPTLSDFYSIE
ncbi:hypothetical protein V8C35DRAFT_313544 [Trichoderma chlorosporum]